jgi:hypothetical protein
MKFGTWILALCKPLLAKIFVSLGFSVVTIVGLQSALSGLKSQFISSVNLMPANMISLFLLGGGGTALGIIFGAMTTKILLWQIQQSTKILGTNS